MTANPHTAPNAQPVESRSEKFDRDPSQGEGAVEGLVWIPPITDAEAAAKRDGRFAREALESFSAMLMGRKKAVTTRRARSDKGET